ncbi:unnamed protein product, partial [Prunus brigantina]
DVDSLQSELWNSLHNKRYLIVLDDVWTEDQDDWDKLRPLFRQGVDGCKIIVTTRSQKIPLMMDFPNSPFFLNGLTDVDCWSLFKQRAFQRGEEEKYPNLQRIGKKIVKKCGGVPLAAKNSFSNLPNARPQVGVSGSHTAPQQLRTYLAGLRQGPEKVIQGLQPHKNLKKLVIDGYPGTKFPHWVLPNLIAANFTNCRSCEHLPALGNLPLLKTLSLHGMHGVKSIEWSNANDGNEFPKLKELSVKSCPNLAHIPLPQSLQHLELRDCNPTMMSIADLSLLYVLILEKIPDLVSLPDGLFASASLSSLKILSCPKLHSMPLHMQNLSSLKSLTIHWCEELASLPQSLQNLKALESLEISDCHSLTSLPDCGIAGLVSLQTLSIENCSNLTYLSSSLEQLTLLEHLTINCPWFDSLPEGLQNVKTLHYLEIRSCTNLTALPEWFGDLDCLRSLTIYECPELEERCRRSSGEDWLKIAHVPHKYIGSPQVRQSGEARTSGSSSVPKSSH